MSHCFFNRFNRRGFLAAAPILISTGALDLSGSSSRQNLKQTLTPEERARVELSSMARDLDGLSGKGYSCAESLLLVSLRFLEKSEELVWTAAGFGGGLGQKDLCGYLTSGIMAIGLRAGDLEIERPEAKTWSSDLAKGYWKWWLSTAPLHCSEIRTPGSSSQICRRLGLLSAVELQARLTLKT